MVKINKIYTKTGDDGTTGLVGGTRVSKDSLRVMTYGEIDELNAVLGWARTMAERGRPTAGPLAEKLAILQNQLFDLGAELASPPGKELPGQIKLSPADVKSLENWIDQLTADLPELRSFVLPGGTELNAALHLARTVCRRAERAIVSLSKQEAVAETIVKYINRLSDLLFAMARFESHASGTPEYLWAPGGKKAGG